MAVPSPLGDVKIESLISTFVLNKLTLKQKVHLFFLLFYDLFLVPIGCNIEDILL